MQHAERLPPSLIGDLQGDIEQQPSDQTLAERQSDRSICERVKSPMIGSMEGNVLDRANWRVVLCVASTIAMPETPSRDRRLALCWDLGFGHA
jgi:hypothetical protein